MSQLQAAVLAQGGQLPAACRETLKCTSAQGGLGRGSQAGRHQPGSLGRPGAAKPGRPGAVPDASGSAAGPLATFRPPAGRTGEQLTTGSDARRGRRPARRPEGARRASTGPAREQLPAPRRPSYDLNRCRPVVPAARSVCRGSLMRAGRRWAPPTPGARSTHRSTLGAACSSPLNSCRPATAWLAGGIHSLLGCLLPGRPAFTGSPA